MTYPHEANIEGKPRTITGFDDAGRYILDGGERLELKSPDPKGLPIRSRPLRRVAKLKFDGENWFLDGESAKASCIQAQMKRRANSEAHSESQTMQELMERLEKIPFADRWHMVGVAWFNESAATVEGETAEDCEQRRSFLETHGGCGMIEPLPPADCFVPFFLTDFGIIGRQQADGGHDGKSYDALIEGQKHAVHSFGGQGGLILADGQRYTFERLPGGPAGDIFGWQLLEVVRLESWGGDWKWNGKESLDKWLEAEEKKAGSPTQALQRPEFFTRQIAERALAELPPEKKAEVRAVAWFAHDDGAGGWDTPIFLKSFRPVAETAPGATLKPKEAARFDNGFKIAVIPQEDGQVLNLSIGLELQALVFEIIGAGGRLTRSNATKKLIVRLKKNNSDNYQPEKLLKSKTAQALMSAGLIGEQKTGRETVFWAKAQAD